MNKKGKVVQLSQNQIESNKYYRKIKLFNYRKIKQSKSKKCFFIDFAL